MPHPQLWGASELVSAKLKPLETPGLFEVLGSRQDKGCKRTHDGVGPKRGRSSLLAYTSY